MEGPELIMSEVRLAMMNKNKAADGVVKEHALKTLQHRQVYGNIRYGDMPDDLNKSIFVNE